MRELCVFVIMLSSVASNPVMKYSFCVPNTKCEPSTFASNSTLKFGALTSGGHFYGQYQVALLSISCTFNEPLHWILTASTHVGVISNSTKVKMIGYRPLYSYHISFPQAKYGLIRCESYDNPDLAAEIYIAERNPNPRFSYRDDMLIGFVPGGTNRGGRLIIPCVMYAFDQDLNSSAVELKTLRRSDMINASVTPACFSCFPKTQCHGSSCVNSHRKTISERLWNDAGRPHGVNKTGNQWQDCIADPQCAFETMKIAPTFSTVSCNHDDEITCSDHYSADASYPSTCKKEEGSLNNFKEIEGCFVQKFARVVGLDEADFDPRIEFRLKQDGDMHSIYVCSLSNHNYFFAPFHTSDQMLVRLEVSNEEKAGIWNGIFCIMPKPWVESGWLKLLPCSTLFDCEVQLQVVQQRAYFRTPKGIVYGESISGIFENVFGKVIKKPPNSGVVSCHFATSLAHGYMWDLQYFFVGLDSKFYFVSNSLPAEAVISLSKMPTNLTALAGSELEVKCTVATFVVFPHFEFLFQYSNGTLSKIGQSCGLQWLRIESNEEDSHSASQKLTVSVRDCNSVVSIQCRAPYRNSKRHAEAVIIVAPVGAQQKDEQQAVRSSSSTFLPVILTMIGFALVLLCLGGRGPMAIR